MTEDNVIVAAISAGVTALVAGGVGLGWALVRGVFVRHVSDHDELIRLRSEFAGLIGEQAKTDARAKAAHDRLDALVHPPPTRDER